MECFAFPALFAVGTLVITQLGEFQAWEALGINLPRNLAVELFNLNKAVGTSRRVCVGQFLLPYVLSAD